MRINIRTYTPLNELFTNFIRLEGSSCEIVSLRSTLSHERATASRCSVKLFRFTTQLHRTTTKDNIILQTLRDLKNNTAFGRSPLGASEKMLNNEQHSMQKHHTTLYN